MTTYATAVLASLAATGLVVNWVIPVVGGILLLFGVGAILYSSIKRKRGADR